MELINGDCLEVMKDLSDNSVDFLFCDLPYGQTSCKWDCLIDLDLFWKQVNRVCKQDAVMAFTCSVKFGNTLINSNPKCFRYDLVWVKSAACGFLNAKKMPMKKHEMVYIFYRKLAKVYTENIALHHTHKFLKATPNSVKTNLYSSKTTEKPRELYRNEGGQYTPPLPNSVIKEENVVVETRDTTNYKNESDLYGNIERPDFKRKNNESMYNPPLPNSVIKEENVVVEKTQISKKHTAGENNLYGNMNGGTIGNIHGTNYNPPLPNSVIKEENVVVKDTEYENREIKKRNTIKKEENYGKEYLKKKENFRAYNKKLGAKGEESHLYDPPLPNSVIKEENVVVETNRNTLYGNIDIPNYEKRKNGESAYNPPLPNSIMEIKSEKGKHATQKPVPLMEYLIKYFTREGETVLDPTMGSGGTGIACKNLNRKFIGIEMDKDIFDVAVERNK